MTTDELVRLIEQDAASHRDCPSDFTRRHHWPAGCIVTIGSLSSRAGVARRHIESAIQQARLDGVPIITDGGIRVARTAEEARGLAGWLWGRIRSQMDTAAAVEATAARWEAEAPEEQPTLGLVA